MSEIPAVLLVFCPHTAEHSKDVDPIGFVAMIDDHLTYLPFVRSRDSRFHTLDVPDSEPMAVGCRKHGPLSIDRSQLLNQARAATDPKKRFRWPSH